jgi:hypothetical protein
MEHMEGESEMTLYGKVLAYYDSFAGMLPVTVTEYADGRVKFKINTTRGGYFKGQMEESSAIHVIPRAHYHKSRKGPFWFYTTPYNWADLMRSK